MYNLNRSNLLRINWLTLTIQSSSASLVYPKNVLKLYLKGSFHLMFRNIITVNLTLSSNFLNISMLLSSQKAKNTSNQNPYLILSSIDMFQKLHRNFKNLQHMLTSISRFVQ